MAFGAAQGVLGRAGGSEVIGRGIIDIGVSSYRLRHDMRNVGNAVRNESKLWGQAFHLAGVGLASLSSIMVATVVGGISQAEKFNSAMAKIKAMTGVTEESFQQLQKGALEMAKTLPQGPEKLAQALYFVASAGFRSADALKILDQAAKAAAASGADLEVSADALVSVMNAYGLEAKDAAYASNILTRIVVYGKTEFDDLARAIGPVTTISRVAGISLEEMGAAIAMLTQRGLTARRSTNSLWAALRSLSTPTSLQVKTMHALGIKYDSTMLKSKGLINVLKMFDVAVRKATKNGIDINNVAIFDKNGKMNIDKTQAALKTLSIGAGGKPAAFDLWRKLLGQSNAFLVSQILLQKTGETYDVLLKDMYGNTQNLASADKYLTGNMQKVADIADTTNKAFEEAKKHDIGIVWGTFVSQMQVALVQLGEKFIPYLTQAINWLSTVGPQAIQTFSDWLWSTLIPAVKGVWDAFLGMTSAIMDMFGVAGSGGDPVKRFFTVLGAGVTAVLGAIKGVLNEVERLAKTPLIANAAKLLAPWMLFLVALTGIRAAGNSLKNLARGLVPFGGRTGGGASAAAGAAFASQSGSGTGMGGAAAKLSAAAEQLMMAARSLTMGGLGGVGSGVSSTMGQLYYRNGSRFSRVQPSPTGFGGMFAPGTILEGQSTTPIRYAGRYGSTEGYATPQANMVGPIRMTSMRAPAGYGSYSNLFTGELVQGTLRSPGFVAGMKNSVKGFFSGVAGVFKNSAGEFTAGSALKGLLGGGMSLVSKAFWPLMIADLVGSIFKEPLGNILENNPLTGSFFKDAGQRMKTDFWDGMIGIVQDIVSGGKETFAAGLEGVTNINDLKIDTATLGKLGFKKATIGNLQAAEANVSDVVDIANLSALQHAQGQTYAEWQSIYSGQPTFTPPPVAPTQAIPPQYLPPDQRPNAAPPIHGYAPGSASGAVVDQIAGAGQNSSSFMGVEAPSSKPVDNTAWETWAKSIMDFASKANESLPANKQYDLNGIITTAMEKSASGNGVQQVVSYDPEKIKSLAAKLGTNFKTANDKAVKEYNDYIWEKLTTVGDVKFQRTDLSKIPKSSLERLTAVAEENTDGTLNYLQQWMTQQAIAKVKNVSIKTAKDFTSQATTVVEQQNLAFAANLEPAKKSFEDFMTVVKEKANDPAALGAMDWLKQYGNAIETAFNTQKISDQINAVNNGPLKTSFRILDQTVKVGSKVFAAGTIVTGTGKKMAAVNRTEFQSYWHDTYQLFSDMQQTAGMNVAQGVSNDVESTVEDALKQGISMVQIREGLPPGLWQTWISNQGGMSGAVDQLSRYFTTTLQKGVEVGVKNIKTGTVKPTVLKLGEMIKLGDAKPVHRKEILAAFAKTVGLAPGQAPSWQTFKSFFDKGVGPKIKTAIVHQFGEPITQLVKTTDPTKKNKILAWFNKQLPGKDVAWDKMKGLLTVNGQTNFKNWVANFIASPITGGITKAINYAFTSSGKEKADLAKGIGGGSGGASGAANSPLAQVLLGLVTSASDAAFGPEATQAMAAGGTRLVNAVAAGMSDQSVKNALGDALQPGLFDILSNLPSSPPKEGALKGTVLPDAGSNIVKLVAGGMASAAGTLGTSFQSAVSVYLGAGSKAWTSATNAGTNLGLQIANGMASSAVTAAIAQSVALLAAEAKKNLPHGSPARKGPWSGDAWHATFRAGENISKQMAAGMASVPVALPGLDAAATSQSLAHRRNGTNKGNTQKIYADKLQLFNAQDEQDILQLLSFMAPGGR